MNAPADEVHVQNTCARGTVYHEAFLNNTQFVIIRPRPPAFTISSRQNFDLRAVDKVGHEGGLTIGANPSSDGRPRRLTSRQRERPEALRSRPPDRLQSGDDPPHGPWQPCSHDYQKILHHHGFKVSMSGKGNCYDNAEVETFFKTIRAELIWRRSRETRRQAEMAIFEYINGFYNPRRRHSALGWKSPVAFERKIA